MSLMKKYLRINYNYKKIIFFIKFFFEQKQEDPSKIMFLKSNQQGNFNFYYL